jgi:hypothetical protein
MAQGGKRTGGQCHGAMARVMIQRNDGGGDWGKKTPDRWGPPVGNRGGDLVPRPFAVWVGRRCSIGPAWRKMA